MQNSINFGSEPQKPRKLYIFVTSQSGFGWNQCRKQCRFNQFQVKSKVNFNVKSKVIIQNCTSHESSNQKEEFETTVVSEIELIVSGNQLCLLLLILTPDASLSVPAAGNRKREESPPFSASSWRSEKRGIDGQSRFINIEVPLEFKVHRCPGISFWFTLHCLDALSVGERAWGFDVSF